VHWDYLERNVCEGVRVGRGQRERPPRLVWTAAQATHFLACTHDEPDGLLWRLLLLGTLRIGEALALSWNDVDLEAGTVRVGRTLTKSRAGTVVMGDSPKSRDSRRVVDLDVTTVAMLWCRQGASGALICPGRHGAVRRAQGVGRRLAAACAEYGVPLLTPHGLRHTSITLSLEAGLSLLAVSERAGHAQTSITLNTYAHVLPGQAKTVAHALGELLGGG